MSKFLIAGLSLLTVLGPINVQPTAGGQPQAATEAAALARAKVLSKPVEVLNERSETATVWALPNGKMRMEQSLRPIRTKRSSGEWVGVDANLRRNPDGSISPIASTVPMNFSGGGAGPLATIGGRGNAVSIGWLAQLPKPELKENVATYPEVLPGVDLRVVAEVDSFNHVLVVKNRQAAQNPALKRLDYPITTDGVTLSGGAPGVVIGKDRSGAEQWRGTASSWDTAPPAAMAKTRTVGLAIGAGKLSVTPAKELLDSPADRFPIHIDPSWQPGTAGRNSWISVFSAQGGPLYNQPIYDSNMATYGDVKIGKTPAEGWVARAMFQFNTSGLKWKRINRAWLSMTQLWSSSSCGDSGTRRTLLVSTNDYTPQTTWYNQPGWFDTYGYSDAKKFVGNSSCPAGGVEFNATGFMTIAANNGWDHASMGLKAANEGDSLSWKKYRLSSVSMNVEYNSIPSAPDDLWLAGQQCSTAQPIYTGDKRPTMKARLNDIDPGATLTGYGHWADGNDNRMVQGGLPNGGYFNQRPYKDLADGTYTFKMSSEDGIDWSQPSAPCTFIVDTVPPDKPSLVSSDIYLPKPADFKRGIGRVGNFTFKPPVASSDVYGYRYGLDIADISAAKFVIANADKTAVVPIIPMESGDRVLKVWAVDRAGNSTTPYEFTFGVARGSGEAAWWTFDQANPLVDEAAAANANNLVAAGGPTFTVGRGGTPKAVELPGGAGPSLATNGRIRGDNPDNPNVVQDFRTDLSFTVSAWVKLDRIGQYQTMVSVEGNIVSAFFLQSGPDRWRFGMPPTDAMNPGMSVAQSNSPPVIGRWTHVAGVYDATAKQVRLYVDGKLQGSPVAAPTVVSAVGPLMIGKAVWNDVVGDWVDGKIDDVHLWDRVLSDAELLEQAMPLPPIVELSATSVTYGGSLTATFKTVGAESSVVKYKYQVDGQTPQFITPSTPGGQAVVTISGLAPGQHNVTAWAVNIVDSLSAFNRKDFKVRLAPKISGTIYDVTTGEPAAGVTVTAAPGGYTATTAANGTYSMTGMPVGNYTVSATVGGRRCGLFGTDTKDVLEPTLVDLYMNPQQDAFGYTCVEQTRPFVDGTDSPETRADLTGDETSKAVALPFSFPFYGQNYNTAYLSSNGVVSFAPIDVVDSENHPVPSDNKPNGAIYPYWTDLLVTPYPNSSVLTKVFTDGGEEAFVIHYHGMRVYDQTPRVSFEVILYQSGKIVVNYTKIDQASELERGNTATIGIESGDGMTGFLYSYNEPVVADNKAIVFMPPAN